MSYSSCRVAMGTRHQKEHQVAPAFAALLDARIVVPPNLDTDQFGTFTGERPRTLSATDAARAKALLGMSSAGTDYGLASEATYGVLDDTGLTMHEEILLFVDAVRGIEVVETERVPSVAGRRHTVRTADEFPASLLDSTQGWTVRQADGRNVTDVSKGLTTASALRRAITEAARHSPDGRAIVEPDLRAMHNPSRRVVITRLSYRMAARLQARCPRCGTPGYGRTGVQRGLPCRFCGTETDLVRADVYGCAACEHREHRDAATAADPQWCPFCNP